MNHRHLATLALVYASALAVTGVMGANTATAASNTVTFAVGVDPSFAPVFVAKAEGLFKKHGLQVDVQQYGNAGEAANALVAGSADVAGVPAFNLLMRATRAPLNAIGVFAEGKGNYVKVAVSPKVTGPKDVTRIGVVPGTFSQYAADRFVEAFHLDPTKVTTVKAGPPVMPELLHQGRINAFILWNPWPARAKKLGGKILMPIGKFGLHFLMTVSVRHAWLKDHHTQAEALLAALSEATALVKEDPAEAAAVTKKAAKIPEPLTKLAIKEIDFKVRDLNHKDQAHFASMLDFLMKKKIIQSKPSLDKLIVHGVVPSSDTTTSQ